MVLNKSKWDHKAKIQYLKKHKLTRPKIKEDRVIPKWSGKQSKEKAGNSWLDESDDSEWDSEDEAMLNHFYPQISEDNLSVEIKQKLKRQIVKVVKQREDQTEEQHESQYDEENGIYLGEKPVENEQSPDVEYDDQEYHYSDDEFELEIPDLEVKLSEFIVSDLARSKNRKLLKNKVSENLLEEYGIESYSSTVRDTDYNDSVKIKFKNIDKLSAADLHGLRIGEAPGNETRQPKMRVLDEAELEEHRARTEKLKHVKFQNQIKKKFGLDTSNKSKVLEINNFNANDKSQMASLNSKLIQTSERSCHDSVAMAEDLDMLLGLESEGIADIPDETFTDDGPLDFLSQTLAKASASLKVESEKRKSSIPKKVAPDAFLDDLLGL